MNNQMMINFAMQMLQRNPKFQKTPMGQNLIQIIQSGDSQKGQQIAENLCQTYGVPKEQAIQQAKKFFGIR